MTACRCNPGRFVGDEGSRIGDGVAPSVRGDDALADALSAALSNMQGGSAGAPPGQPFVEGLGEPLADALSEALGQPAGNQGASGQSETAPRPERTVSSSGRAV